MRALEMEDSTILEQKPVQSLEEMKKEVAIVSSKQVPINKLDLGKVAEIQKMQANGTLPPLEESQIINRKEMKDQVKEMVMLDALNESQSSRLENKRQFLKEQMNEMMESFHKQNKGGQNYYEENEDDEDLYGNEYDQEEDEKNIRVSNKQNRSY